MYMTILPIQDTRANRPLALINRIRASIDAKHCKKDAAHGVKFCMYKLEHLSSHSGNTWVPPEHPGHFVTFATPPPQRTRNGVTSPSFGRGARSCWTPACEAWRHFHYFSPTRSRILLGRRVYGQGAGRVLQARGHLQGAAIAHEGGPRRGHRHEPPGARIGRGSKATLTLLGMESVCRHSSWQQHATCGHTST